MGYHRAGFDVVGVDIEPQPNYPFEFIQADIMEFIDEHGYEFDAIHVSPPCQAHSSLTKGNRGREGWQDNHVDLIPAVRQALIGTGKPYVIENVEAARGALHEPFRLCGLSFGLKVFRHRQFEVTFPIVVPDHPSHRGHRVAGWRHGKKYDGDMVAVYGEGGGKGSVNEWQGAMGIDWTGTRKELAEAIPPAYTEYIGKFLMDAL